MKTLLLIAFLAIAVPAQQVETHAPSGIRLRVVRTPDSGIVKYRIYRRGGARHVRLTVRLFDSEDRLLHSWSGVMDSRSRRPWAETAWASSVPVARAVIEVRR